MRILPHHNLRQIVQAAALAFGCVQPVFSQAAAYSISTIAGVGIAPFVGEGQVATSVLLFSPSGVAVGPNGTIYFSDTYCQRVFQVTTQGTLATVAGTGQEGYSGDGGRATSAQLHGPAGLAVDGAGNLYIADSVNQRIRKVTPAGTISSVAGNGAQGFSGDGGQATSATLNSPADVKLDAAGNLYIADAGNNRIRKVTTAGVISTIAGNGQVGFGGDGGSAIAAQLQSPGGVAVDGSGNLYIADSSNCRVREVNINGTISTIAGTGIPGSSGNGGLATKAQLADPRELVLDSSGNLYVTDEISSNVREITSAGVISTFAGGGSSALNGGDGGTATAASMILPNGIAIDASGNIYVAESEGRRVRRIDGASLIITRTAGEDITNTSIGDGGNPLQASLYDPAGVALDGQGNLLLSDNLDLRVRAIGKGIITTFAGDGVFGEGPFGGQATAMKLDRPSALTVDASGNVYIVQAYEICKVAPNGVVSQFAGTGGEGFSGDNGPAINAEIYPAQQIAFDAAGNLYIPDAGNNRIRMVNTSGTIVTIAGTGTPGFSGDGGPAALAQLYNPSGVAIDSAGNIYISDSGNNRIRKISIGGTITTIAGTGVQGAAGDGGPAIKAELSAPSTLAFDSSGTLYICLPSRIRTINSAGVIDTIAGTGFDGYSGDGGPATSALMNSPSGLAFDSGGNIYFADSGNQVVRELSPAQFFSNGVVNAASLLAGPVAPGEIITIFGSGIGPSQYALPSLNSSGSFSNDIGSTQVLFDGAPAPMLFASAGQVSAIVPYEIAGQTQTKVQILHQGQPTNTVTLNVAATAPALFTANSSGSGQGSVLNQDGSVNSVSNPAAAGSIVILFGTGAGQTNPAGQDGSVATSVYPAPIQPVSVQMNGNPAQVLYAGAAPDEVAGLLQINAQIPAGVTGNAVSVVVFAGTTSSPSGVAIAVR